MVVTDVVVVEAAVAAVMVPIVLWMVVLAMYVEVLVASAPSTVEDPRTVTGYMVSVLPMGLGVVVQTIGRRHFLCRRLYAVGVAGCAWLFCVRRREWWGKMKDLGSP